MRFYKIEGATLASLLYLAVAFSAERWEAPEDGRITEMQMQRYLACGREWNHYIRGTAGYTPDNALPTGVSITELNKKWEEIFARNKTTNREYSWIGTEVMKALLAADAHAGLESVWPQIMERKKKVTDDIAAAQAQIEKCQAALKASWRVLREGERPAAIQRAIEQLAREKKESAGNDAYTAAELNTAARANAAAIAADALADKPPGGIPEGQLEDYIAQKRAEAATQRTIAAESRSHAKESRSRESDYKSRIEGYARQIEHPEIPATPAERDYAIDETKARVKEATEQLATALEALADDRKRDEERQRNLDAQHKDLNEEN